MFLRGACCCLRVHGMALFRQIKHRVPSKIPQSETMGASDFLFLPATCPFWLFMQGTGWPLGLFVQADKKSEREHPKSFYPQPCSKLGKGKENKIKLDMVLESSEMLLNIKRRCQPNITEGSDGRKNNTPFS